jgi:hypothetical protein
VCRPLRRRRRVETFAVHNSETAVAQNVGRRSLLEAHVNYVRLLDGLDSGVTVRQHIQRRHVFLRISPSKNPMKYIIVSAVGPSRGPAYTILVSGRCVLRSNDLATTYISPLISTHLPNRVHQSVRGWSLLDAHVVYVGLQNGVGSESDCVPTSSAKATS